MFGLIEMAVIAGIALGAVWLTDSGMVPGF
jgi:hypothetical protein